MTKRINEEFSQCYYYRMQIIRNCYMIQEKRKNNKKTIKPIWMKFNFLSLNANSKRNSIEKGIS